ncbi:MAG: hypothetical protein L0Z73_07185 [Gammaproteobacteria bacterium]|nr:hypothetical protein [Gammaproteobacteria bacterium]
MRLKIFVHSLLLALCSFGVATVLAAKDSQTDIGAVPKHEVTIEVADSAFAGAQAAGSSIFRHASEMRGALLIAAAQTGQSSAQQPSTQDNDSKSSPKRDSFQSLDVEAEKLLHEVLDLSSDLAITSEEHVNPPKNQLLVLVTLQPSKFFELDYVELEIDQQAVAAQPYTEKDIAAMVRGGGHRLYLANLPAGTHELKAKFVGKVPRDPDYRREATFKFISGVNRTLIELYINSGENSGFPQFTIREWN